MATDNQIIKFRELMMKKESEKIQSSMIQKNDSVNADDEKPEVINTEKALNEEINVISDDKDEIIKRIHKSFSEELLLDDNNTFQNIDKPESEDIEENEYADKVVEQDYSDESENEPVEEVFDDLSEDLSQEETIPAGDNSETDNSENIDFDDLLSRFEESSGKKSVEKKPANIANQNSNKNNNLSKTVNRPKTAATKNKTVRTAKYVKSPLNAVIIAIFSVLLISLSVISISVPDREYSEKENRSLTSLPQISLASISSGDFMKRFDTYLSDQIVFRDQFVSLRTFIMQLLGKHEVNDVIIGQDGWLFEKPVEPDDAKLSATMSSIIKFTENCEIENKAFVVVPNSSYIVSSELPAGYKPFDQKKIIDGIYKQLNEKFLCVDAASILSSLKNKKELYYKTDHHWTTSAAKSIFNNLAEEWDLNTDGIHYENIKLTDSFYGTLSSSSGIKHIPDTINAIVPSNCKGTYVVQNVSEQTRTASVFDTSKLDNDNKYEVFFGGNFARINIDTVNVTNNKLIILKDSYSNCFIPMLTPYFNEIVIIDARYYNDNVRNIIEKENFTHMLIMYNLNTFLEDVSLKDIL